MMSEKITTSNKRQTTRMKQILDRLSAAYPEAHVGLDFRTPFELLIATILSAQCTDVRVNIVTKDLFKKYKTPQDFILAPSEELESDIRTTGFFRNKAKHIKACCERLVSTFNAEVPRERDDLVSLPGVGRKTANCVVSNCFGVPAITVDTHVIRISNLLGFVDDSDPVRIEHVLMEITDRQRWNDLNHVFITHGRTTCIARRPRCSECAIHDLCPSARL